MMFILPSWTMPAVCMTMMAVCHNEVQVCCSLSNTRENILGRASISLTSIFLMPIKVSVSFHSFLGAALADTSMNTKNPPTNANIVQQQQHKIYTIKSHVLDGLQSFHPHGLCLRRGIGRVHAAEHTSVQLHCTDSRFIYAELNIHRADTTHAYADIT